MFSQFARISIAATAAVFALVGSAVADDWHIARSSGPIWVGSDTATLVSLGAATDVPGGATVMTGDGGRALLVRGTQTMLIGPNAVVTVPESDTNGITTILQRAGEVTFDVDRRTVKHFAVETPYLAAVVKGTNFTVSIDDQGAGLSVDRGLVQVTDLITGEQADTPAGQKAAVSGPAAKFTIFGAGDLPAVINVGPRAPLVAPLNSQTVHVLQVAALKASATGLSPVTVDLPRDNAAAGAVAVAAGGAGGSGGGSGGSAVTGGDSGAAGGGAGAGPTVIAMQGVPAIQTISLGGSGPRYNEDEGFRINPMALAIAFILSVMLAVGFAFLKGRAS